MPEPSPIFLLAAVTLVIAIALAGVQLARVRHARRGKLGDRAEKTTPQNDPEYTRQNTG